MWGSGGYVYLEGAHHLSYILYYCAPSETMFLGERTAGAYYMPIRIPFVSMAWPIAAFGAAYRGGPTTTNYINSPPDMQRIPIARSRLGLGFRPNTPPRAKGRCYCAVYIVYCTIRALHYILGYI